jgi:hypothetical protein
LFYNTPKSNIRGDHLALERPMERKRTSVQER